MKPEVLIIGRFQPFHNGHLAVVKKFLEEGYKVIIGLGGPKKKEDKDLFTADERKEMITKVIQANGLSDVEIKKIPNIPNDSKYVEHVENLINQKPDLIFSGNSWVYELFEEAGYKVEKINEELDRIGAISSTKIRELICEGAAWEELVPEEIAEYIKSNHYQERVKKFCSLK